jgi:phenylalanyl-tRNA synthetase beta chain
MKLEYKKIIDFLENKPSTEELSKKLFQLGHEHEVDGETFDMELTPNRGDCLSLAGLARDLSVFYGKAEEKKIYTADIPVLELDFENQSQEDCKKISFLEIEIDKVPKKYKPYISDYLENLDVNSNNFFTDISNYLSYELGQPTHCYDSFKIKNKLVFTKNSFDSKFESLLGPVINLTDDNCVFKADNEIINLAGIMGGKSTSCNDKTTKALVECAFFNPESIMGKAVKYNIISDAAHKFERGVDILAQENVLRRFAQIVSEHANIVSIKMKTFEHIPYKPKYINIDVNKINDILGTNLSNESYLEILDNLNFSVIKNCVEIPSFRNDLTNQNDLAEEVARVIGYDNIDSKAFEIPSCKNLNKTKEDILRSFLQTNNFNEVINFPFTENNSVNSIKVDNPLDTNKTYLRTSLKNSLINNLLYNERRQNDYVKLFEISDIYSKEKSITQEKIIGIIASGRQGHNYKDFSRKIDEKYLDNIFNSDKAKLKFDIEEIPRSELDSKIKNKIFYIETKLSLINTNTISDLPEVGNANFIEYKEISTMPSSIRDISFSLDSPDSLNDLFGVILKYQSLNLKNVFCFDFFENPETSIIKVGFRFIFQSKTHSLNDQDIEKELIILITETLNISGITIPGLKF